MSLDLTVTNLRKKGQSGFIVEFGSHSVIVVPIDLVVKHKIKKGRVFQEDEFNKLVSEIRLIEAKQEALKFISYKPRTVQQVHDKLKSKGFEEENILRAIEFLEEFGYLNDATYAKQFYDYFVKTKKYSHRRAIVELRKRGIKGDILTEFAEPNEYSDEQEFRNARDLAIKKLKAIRTYKGKDRFLKVFNYLINKGFSYEIARRVVEELKSSFAHPEGLEPPTL